MQLGDFHRTNIPRLKVLNNYMSLSGLKGMVQCYQEEWTLCDSNSHTGAEMKTKPGDMQPFKRNKKKKNTGVWYASNSPHEESSWKRKLKYIYTFEKNWKNGFTNFSSITVQRRRNVLIEFPSVDSCSESFFLWYKERPKWMTDVAWGANKALTSPVLHFNSIVRKLFNIYSALTLYQALC